MPNSGLQCAAWRTLCKRHDDGRRVNTDKAIDCPCYGRISSVEELSERGMLRLLQDGGSKAGIKSDGIRGAAGGNQRGVCCGKQRAETCVAREALTRKIGGHVIGRAVRRRNFLTIIMKVARGSNRWNIKAGTHLFRLHAQGHDGGDRTLQREPQHD